MNVQELVTPADYFEGQFFEVLHEAGCFHDNIPCAPPLSLRVKALAHAAIQALYAQVVLIPAMVIGALSVIKYSKESPFFSRNESLFARIAAVCVATFSALFSPVISSVLLAIIPSNLQESFHSPSFSYNSIAKEIIRYAMLPRLYLFALTLPSLSELDKIPEGDRERTIFGPIMSNLQPNTLSSSNNNLDEVERRAFRWKIALPPTMLLRLMHHPERCATMYQHTRAFYEDVAHAVHAATVPDDQPINP